MEMDLWVQLLQANIDEAEAIYRLAQDYGILDQQEFLDWQDKLNDISCR